MVIVCPSCATEYTIEPSRVGRKGRDVRCGHCRTSWFVVPAGDTTSPNNASAVVPALTADRASRTDHAVEADQRQLRSPPTKGARQGARGAGQGGSLHAKVLLATVGLALAIVAFRSPIVRVAPRTSTLFAALGLPVNLVGLTLEDISSNITEEGGRPVLVAVGRISNATRRDLAVPDLEITLVGGRGQALYKWAMKPPSPEIGSGEVRRFSVRLASPPPDASRIRLALRNAAEGEAVASPP